MNVSGWPSGLRRTSYDAVTGSYLFSDRFVERVGEPVSFKDFFATYVQCSFSIFFIWSRNIVLNSLFFLAVLFFMNDFKLSFFLTYFHLIFFFYVFLIVFLIVLNFLLFLFP